MKKLLIFLLLSSQLLSSQLQLLGPVPLRPAPSGKSAPIRASLPSSGAYAPVGGVPVGTLVLTDSSYVSAMIETEDGDLVRWLNKAELVGTGPVTFYWNGRNEQDVDVTASGREQYYLRYAYWPKNGGVTYTWEGPVGNSSSEKVGNNRHRSWSPLSGMWFVGNRIYYNNMYQEGSKDCWLNYVLKDNIQFNYRVESANMGNNGVTRSVLKNGVVYSNNNFIVKCGGSTCIRNFVSAIDATTLAQKAFTGSSEPRTATTGTNYSSVINYNESFSGTISDLAASDTALFVVQNKWGLIRVNNSTSGERSFTIKNLTAPKYVDVQNNTHLWVVWGTAGKTLQKFAISGISGGKDSATVASPLLTITVDNALDIAISPDQSQIAVVEAGTTQQVRFYSTATGALLNTLGQPGGYATSATIANDKFMFSSSVDNDWQYSFIAFDPADNSVWFGDSQNRRSMHFSADRQYIEQIQLASRPYSCWLDPKNPTRLFQGYLEYKIDYAKPLQPGNGSWELVANWTPQGSLAPNYTDNKELASPVTLSNGRTYARLRNTTSNNADLFELVAGGTARRCGTSSTVNVGLGYYLYPEGMRQVGASSAAQTWSLKAVTGFDGNNNPILASPVSDMVIYQVGGYYPTPGGTQFSPGTITGDGYYVSFDGDAMNAGKYHLGLAKKGKTTWRSMAAYTTTHDYFGPYPPDDAFDIGNNLGPQSNGSGRGYAGSVAMAAGRHVFWGYHGEFWKNGQTNKWIHHLSNGLYIGQCGIVRPDNSLAPAGFGGNALFAAIAEVNGVVYFYHSEENNFSALHRWKVTGLNTIREGRFKINPKVFLTQPGSGGLDLHAGLPFNQDSLSASNSTVGIDPSAVKNSNSDRSIAQTNRVEHRRDRTDRRRKADVTVRHRKNVASPNFVVPFNLGNNKNLTAWRLKGRLSFSDPGSTNNGGYYVEVIDSTGKAIARIQKWDWATSGDSIPQTIVAGTAQNQNVLVSYSTKHAVRPNTADFQITYNGTNLTYKWGNYPELTRSVIASGADAGSPRTYRLVFYQNNTQGRDRQASLLDGEFFNDTPAPTATTYTVGTGSGNLVIDGRDLRADANDRIRITAGNYSSIGITNLTGTEAYPITVETTGLVETSGYLNLSDLAYVRVTGASASNPSARNLYVHDVGYRATEIANCRVGVTLERIRYENIGDYSIFNTTTALTYTGSEATIQMKDFKLLACEFINAGGVGLGGAFNSSTNTGFCKGLEIGFCTYKNRPDAGNVFVASNVEGYAVHDNIVDNINSASNNHNGIFHLTGNGSFYNNLFTNHEGQAFRAWVFSQGSTVKNVYIYNNIVLNSRKYSAFELQSFADLIVTGKSTYANCYVLNNTCDRLDYSGDWIGVVVDVYNLFGGRVTILNNVNARSADLNGTNGIYSDQTSQTPITASNNIYRQSLADAGLEYDSNGLPKPTAGGLLKGAGLYIDPATFGISVGFDFYYRVRTNPPSIGAIN